MVVVVVVVFDGGRHFMASVMDCGKAMVRQIWPAHREDKRAAQGEATQQQQPASMIRGQEEGSATRGQRDMMMQQPAGATRWQEGSMTR
jgi:hypothetical protein